MGFSLLLQVQPKALDQVQFDTLVKTVEIWHNDGHISVLLQTLF